MVTGLKFQKIKDLSRDIFTGAPLYILKTLINGSPRVPIINIKDVQDNKVNSKELIYTSEDDSAKLTRFAVYPGDIIITCRGTQLKLALISESIKKAIITANFIGVRPKDNIEPAYLFAYLRTLNGQSKLLANAKSSTMQLVLNISDISEIEIPVLPLSAQKEIVSLMKTADEQYQLNIEIASLRRAVAEKIISELINSQE